MLTLPIYKKTVHKKEAQQKRTFFLIASPLKQKGQSLVEFLITFPLFLAVLLILIQMGLAYRAKALLNYSTFMAVRVGTFQHASLPAMEQQLMRSLGAFYAKKPGHFQAAMGQAQSVLANQALGVRIDIVHPTFEMFNTFKASRYHLVKCQSNQCQHQKHLFEESAEPFVEVPNDYLAERTHVIRTVTTRRGQEKVSLQDVNLLKINAHWCYPMEVPIVSHLWAEAMKIAFLVNANTNSFSNVCMVRSALTGKIYFPMSSQAIMRMQSPIRCEGGKACTNLHSYRRTL